MLDQIIREYWEQAKRLPVDVFTENVVKRVSPDGVRRYNAPIEIAILFFKDHINTTKVIGRNSPGSRLLYEAGLGDFHRHDYVELVYVYEGAYCIETETERLEIGEKEFLLIDPSLLHREDFRNAAYTALFLCMSRAFFDSIFIRQLEERQEKNLAGFIINALYNPKREVGYLRLRARQSLKAVERHLELMIGELTNRSSGYDFLLKGYMMRLMDVLAPEVYQSLDRDGQRLFQQRLYEQVTEYITQNMAKVTLEDLVGVFHFQKDYFNRLIRKFAQCSFTEILQRIRISRAEYLLAHTDIPVADLVLQIGYRNVTYFYRIFTAQHGMTPAAYREQARQQQVVTG